MAIPTIDNLNPDQPVDQLAAGIIQGITRKGRGFVLSLDEKEGIKGVEIKESLPPHDEYEAPASLRAHEMETTDAFLTFCKRYGTAEKSLVLVNEEGAVLVIDEHIPRGKRELVKMKLSRSADWNDWSEILDNDELEHAELLKFLRDHEHNLSDPGVLQSMSALKVSHTVNHESDVKDDGKTVGFFVKSSKGEDLLRFPKKFNVTLPVLDQDIGFVNGYAAQAINLAVDIPDDPLARPVFSLSCPTWKSELRERVRKEVETIQDTLEGWTVVQGRFRTKKRIQASQDDE